MKIELTADDLANADLGGEVPTADRGVEPVYVLNLYETSSEMVKTNCLPFLSAAFSS